MGQLKYLKRKISLENPMVFVHINYFYSSRRDTTIVNCSLSIVNFISLLLSKSDKHNMYFPRKGDLAWMKNC